MATAAQEIALMQQRMDTLEKKIDDMDKKLDNLTSQLLNPDDGFVARVNKNTAFRKDMEELVSEIYAMKRWRRTIDYVVKALVVAVIGSIVKIFFM
jgi:predicted nuclease with TOPRIM domain